MGSVPPNRWPRGSRRGVESTATVVRSSGTLPSCLDATTDRRAQIARSAGLGRSADPRQLGHHPEDPDRDPAAHVVAAENRQGHLVLVLGGGAQEIAEVAVNVIASQRRVTVEPRRPRREPDLVRLMSVARPLQSRQIRTPTGTPVARSAGRGYVRGVQRRRSRRRRISRSVVVNGVRRSSCPMASAAVARLSAARLPCGVRPMVRRRRSCGVMSAR